MATEVNRYPYPTHLNLKVKAVLNHTQYEQVKKSLKALRFSPSPSFPLPLPTPSLKGLCVTYTLAFPSVSIRLF